jgi:hypothetical protein
VVPTERDSPGVEAYREEAVQQGVGNVSFETFTSNRNLVPHGGLISAANRFSIIPEVAVGSTYLGSLVRAPTANRPIGGVFSVIVQGCGRQDLYWAGR